MQFLDNSRHNPCSTGAVFVLASYREFLDTPKNMNSLDNPLGGGVPAPVQLATGALLLPPMMSSLLIFQFEL